LKLRPQKSSSLASSSAPVHLARVRVRVRVEVRVRVRVRVRVGVGVGVRKVPVHPASSSAPSAASGGVVDDQGCKGGVGTQVVFNCCVVQKPPRV
jgi:hypothetical protein